MDIDYLEADDDTLDVSGSDKITDWENEPALADLKADVTNAESETAAHVSDVDRWRDNLFTKVPVNSKEGRSKIVPKLIRKQAEWRYSSLSAPFLSTGDLFNVSPYTFEDVEKAKQNELVLNHQFNNRIAKVEFIDEVVRVLVNEGTAVIKIGWDYQEEELEREVPVFEYNPTINPQVIQLLQQIAAAHQAMAQQGPSVESVGSGSPEMQQAAQFLESVPPEMMEAFMLTQQTGTPHEPIQTGFETETYTKVVKNAPVLEVCHYKSIIIDPSCEGDLKKANFVVYSFETSLSDLEKAGIYQNLDEIDINNNSPLSAPDSSINDEVSSFNFRDKPRKKFIAYEYWGFWDIDGSGKTKPIVVTYVGDVVIRMEENPFPDKELPFVVIPYLPIPRSIYGEPDGELLEDNQKIVGAVTRGMIDIMARSANGQIGVRRDALDIANRRKFMRGDDYEYNANIDPRMAFHTHVYPEIPQSAMSMIELQNIDAESLTGVKAFHSGIQGQALGESATGIRSALDATAKRELDILRRLANGIIKIGKKIISMNAEFLQDEEIIRITNDEFLTVNRDNLTGEYDVQMSISTPEEDQKKVQDQAFMLQTLGNSIPFEITKMVMSKITDLSKMPDLAEAIRNYQPQPDPVAQKMQELELAKLEAEIMVERAKVLEMQSQAQLDSAKAQNELADARQKTSLADKQDLDFVEQESGVTQERDLQKLGEQARSNVFLKRMESQYKQQTEREKLAAQMAMNQTKNRDA